MRTLRLSEAEADAHIDRLLSAQERVVPQNRAALAERGKARGLAIASHADETAEHVADAAAPGISVTGVPTNLAAARAARHRKGGGKGKGRAGVCEIGGCGM